MIVLCSVFPSFGFRSIFFFSTLFFVLLPVHTSQVESKKSKIPSKSCGWFKKWQIVPSWIIHCAQILVSNPMELLHTKTTSKINVATSKIQQIRRNHFIFFLFETMTKPNQKEPTNDSWRERLIVQHFAHQSFNQS